jgi:hypothetical protein
MSAARKAKSAARPAVTGPAKASGPAKAGGAGFRLPDGTRSVQSPWVWRGFFFMSLIALGLCLSFVAGHKGLYAGAWALIALGWFTISMWLWRRHVRDDDLAWQQSQAGRSR